tara:strand:+ start:172 stop:756 length:585 start_codon:yes stop_codon:yes gene_type:complete
MTKSQFNIKISKDLLAKVKRQAMMSGKSLTEHITDLVTKSLAESENNGLTNFDNIKDLEDRLLSVESIVRNREYLSEKLDPFTDSEAVNCTNFMKTVFDQELKKRNFVDKNQAFNDFLKHVNSFGQMNEANIDRLKEILISDKQTFWTGKELNSLVGDDKCNCPIRKGLINWTGRLDCPSQQEICDKGDKLLSI